MIMVIRKTLTGILFCFLTGSVWPAMAVSSNSAVNDVRILIDVSGSMKQNDPENLRRPALRLLTGLLNDNNNAGIWTFGRYVNMLVPPARVDSTWKARAREASTEINSYGLFTNIEGALRDATWDWMPADKHQRSVILLTDGLVDVADDDKLDQASRSRILDEILPKLKAADIHIHTIALSDQADTTLLQQMSRATQGSYTTASTSAELERVFLHLFEASTRADTLPLRGNTVQVDGSISEMTLLIFHQPAAKPTRIQMPNGVIISQIDKPEHIKWHGEQDYDLITIQRPIEGAWKVDAKTDPDNRVVVVTDLKLETDPLPANLSVNDSQKIDIRLREKGDTVINNDFLHFIKVTATQFDDHGRQEQTWTLLDNGMREDRRENDGVYTLRLGTPLMTGHHEVVIDVDGKTFNRQQRLSFEAFAQPVITAVETNTEGALLYVSPIDGLIDADSMQVSARVDNESQVLPVARTHQNEWLLPLYSYDPGQPHQVTLSISGTRNGQAISTQLEPVVFGRPAAQEHETPPTSGHHADDAGSFTEEQTTSPTAGQDDSARVATKGKVAEKPRMSPLTVMFDVLFINLVFAGIIIFLYRKFKHKLPATHQLEELTNE